MPLLYSSIQSPCKFCQWRTCTCYILQNSLPASCVSDERAPVIFYKTVSLHVVSVTNVHLLYSTIQSHCKLCQWRTCSWYILQHSLPASCVSDERAPVIFYNTVSLQVVSVTNVFLLYSITQSPCKLSLQWFCQFPSESWSN